MELTCNVVLISKRAAKMTQFCITRVYTCILFPDSFVIGHNALSIFPCALWPPLSFTCFVYSGVYLLIPNSKLLVYLAHPRPWPSPLVTHKFVFHVCGDSHFLKMHTLQRLLLSDRRGYKNIVTSGICTDHFKFWAIFRFGHQLCSQRNSIAGFLKYSSQSARLNLNHLTWQGLGGDRQEWMQELILPGVSPHPRETQGRREGCSWETGWRMLTAPGQVLRDQPGWEARRPLALPAPPTGLGSQSECFMALQDSLPKVTHVQMILCLHLTSSQAKTLSVWEPPTQASNWVDGRNSFLMEHL